MGLKPLLRKVWARKGERPRAVVARRYQWFHVCSFVEPEGGASLSLLADGMDSTVMRWVVLDRAGWQVSQRVEVPGGWIWSTCRPAHRSYSPRKDVAVGEGGGGPPVL